MVSKETGFHPSDPDWTQGRGIAVAQANAIARREKGMSRKVVLAANAALEALGVKP